MATPIQKWATSTDFFILRDSNNDILIAQGVTLPANATTGYAKWALFIVTNVVSGTSGLNCNKGTNLSCLFTTILQV